MNASRRERRAQRQAERESHNELRRDHAQARARNKRILNYTIGIIILAAAGYGLFTLLRPDNSPGEYDALAQCLTQKGVAMYGTDWCPHCQAQKADFGNSFRYVTYINCDTSKAACDAAGVEGYPTWVFPTGEPLAGQQPLSLLAERADCAVNVTA